MDNPQIGSGPACLVRSCRWSMRVHLLWNVAQPDPIDEHRRVGLANQSTRAGSAQHGPEPSFDPLTTLIDPD